MEYTLIRSSRRSVSMELRPDGQLLVRAPYLMSAKAIDSFVASHGKWIRNARRRQEEKRSRCPAPLSTEEAEHLRTLAKSVLPGLVAYYAGRMGLPVPKIRITSAKTRYGSCSEKNDLSFSRYLMVNSQEAIDYVVVHELAHMRHKNHGKAFWNEVASVLPDWKQRRKSLIMPETEKDGNAL